MEHSSGLHQKLVRGVGGSLDVRGSYINVWVIGEPVSTGKAEDSPPVWRGREASAEPRWSPQNHARSARWPGSFGVGCAVLCVSQD